MRIGIVWEILVMDTPLAIHLSVLDNDDRFQYLFANPNLIVGIYELELTLSQFKNHRISPRINSQCPDLSRHQDGICGNARDLRQGIVKRHTEIQEFVDDIDEIVNGTVDVIDVQVRRDCCRFNTLRHSFLNGIPTERACTVSYVKDNASFNCCMDRIPDLAIFVQDTAFHIMEAVR